MKTFPTLFTQEKNRKRGAQPVWILKCPFASTGTLYLSDNAFSIATWESGITTKAWVEDWGKIDENINFGAGSPSVSSFNLSLIAAQNETTDIGDILWTAANNIETVDCELYLWFIGLDPATDPPQKRWTGNIVDFRQVSDLVYEVEFADQSVKNNKILGNLLNTTAYASLPAENVGKIAPIVYGSVTGHKPICIVSGGYSELAEDLDNSETGVDLIDASSFGTSGYTINVNGEIMTVTGKSGNTLTVTRSAAPATHTAGDPVVQITTITYMVADHPIKALNHVYVDGVELTSGYTFYTGQTGDEHPTYAGKAILVITNAMPAAFDEVQTVDPSGASGTGWANPSYTYDDNEANYSHCLTDGYPITITFAAPTGLFGSIKQQRVNLKWSAYPDVEYMDIRASIGGVEVILYTGDTYNHDGWTDYFSASTDGPLVFWAETGISGDGMLWIYEVRSKEITFVPYASGSTCEEVIVGGEVTVDIDGYQDTAGGDYTGTGNALIEQPDHIYKHLLYTYLAVPTANFSTDATAPFATDSYTFGIVIDVQKTAKEWLARMAWECRSWFRFGAGLAQLLYRPDSLSSDKTITAAMIGMDENGSSHSYPERSPLDEVINKVRARYNRDWSGSSGDDLYAGLYEATDATSVARYGEKENPGLFCFDFITAAAMAQDVADFYLARYKDRKKIVEMQLFLDNAELEFADAVTIEPLSSLVCEVQKVNTRPGSGRDMRNDMITIIAKEY